MDDASFIRYLSAKKTVDDRALNRRVWDAMTARVGSLFPRVLELGGGIGTMVERAAADPVLRPRSWTLVDGQVAFVQEARRRLAGLRKFPVEFLCADVEDFIAGGIEPFDLVIANAFLDLFYPARILPKLLKLARSSGSFLFSITFDGLTALEPEVDRELDRRIVDLYHRSMDERIAAGKVSGDSRCGRHLLTLLPQTGAPDDVYLAMAREFDPAEQVALTLAIVAINGWNRLAVGFRRPVGSYVSSRHPEPATMP